MKDVRDPKGQYHECFEMDREGITLTDAGVEALRQRLAARNGIDFLSRTKMGGHIAKYRQTKEWMGAIDWDDAEPYYQSYLQLETRADYGKFLCDCCTPKKDLFDCPNWRQENVSDRTSRPSS